MAHRHDSSRRHYAHHSGKQTMIRDFLFVALGGALGAVARYAVSLAAAHFCGKNFPWGTLIVNVAGCFAMGLVLEIMADLEAHSPEALTVILRDQLTFWH